MNTASSTFSLASALEAFVIRSLVPNMDVGQIILLRIQSSLQALSPDSDLRLCFVDLALSQHPRPHFHTSVGAPQA